MGVLPDLRGVSVIGYRGIPGLGQTDYPIRLEEWGFNPLRFLEEFSEIPLGFPVCLRLYDGGNPLRLPLLCLFYHEDQGPEGHAVRHYQKSLLEFLKNQFRAFCFDQKSAIHLIHDNSGEFRHFPYKDFGITSLRTTPYSPNMNCYMERFNRSIRTECLDHFVVMNYRHLHNLVKGYVAYYNSLRPHQGLKNSPPDGAEPVETGEIRSKPILFGLQHHFYRAA